MGKVSYTEEIRSTPEQVWAILADVTRMPEWAYTEGRFPYPVEARYGGEQKEGVGTVWVGVSADGQTAQYRVVTWDPPRQMAYELQGMENAGTAMAQTNTFILEPSGDATRVTWTVDWKLTGGFSLNSLLLRLTGNGAFEEMIAGSLENLKRLAETK